MEDVKGGRDKLELLRDVLARHHSKGQRTLIFCNTVASCRAVEYALNQVRPTLLDTGLPAVIFTLILPYLHGSTLCGTGRGGGRKLCGRRRGEAARGRSELPRGPPLQREAGQPRQVPLR